MKIESHFALARGIVIAYLNDVPRYAGRLDKLPRDQVFDRLVVNPLDVRYAEELTRVTAE